MPQDIFKPRGATKASRPDSGGANIRSVPVLGIVKDNIDPTRSGRIFVYISDNSGADPENRDNWRAVRFLSPFYGRVNADAGDSGYGSYKTNPSSYGIWNAPPDIGTTVVCIFINGDMNYGFYIGCVPEPEALTMVPAIGATDNVIPNSGEAESYGGATRLPVTNINTNNTAISDGPTYLVEPKPIHSYSAAIMTQQGIIRDPIRGPISTSSQRETPSRVGWGVSTPGRPIYEGGFDDETVTKNLEADKAQSLRVVARRGGHTFVMDDGDLVGGDQLVRIRTAIGHQILMSDTGQTLFILHANGQSYIELGKEGTIDLYSTNSVNVRTQGDLNLHADNNINIHAKKDFNLHAENINVDTDKEFKQKTGTDHKLHVASKYTTKSDGPTSFEAAGDISLASKSIAYVNGSKVNLNTGKTSTVPQAVKPIPQVAHTDTLFDKSKGFIAAPGKLMSITSRAPAHAPWANAGQGVDIKTELSASASLPSSPAPAVESVNQTAATSISNPVTVATASTMPPSGPISAALDQNTTNAILGQMAQTNANSPTAAAATLGSTVVDTDQGKVAAVGPFGQTPEQLEQGGVLKPGSAKLINSLIESGVPIDQAMTSNLFTGKPGAETIDAIRNNTTAQAKSAVANLQKSQTSLTNAGAITGTEAPEQVAGLVLSGATAGTSKTLAAVKNVATGIVQNISGGTSAVMKAIGAGNFAAGLAQTAGGALGPIAQSANSMIKSLGLSGLVNKTKGIAATAFGAIAASLKPLKPNVPQSLTGNALVTAEKAFANPTSLVNNATSTTTGLAEKASAIQSGIAGSAATTIATGLSNMPGGQGAISNVKNLADTSLNKLPGTEEVGELIKSASASAMNGIAMNMPLPSTSDLTSLAASKLPAGPAAQLAAGISAISSPSSAAQKLPTIGINTTERGEVTAQIVSLLSDPGIPKPNLLGEVSKPAAAEFKKKEADQREKTKKALEAMEAVNAAKRKAEDAAIKYGTLKEELPKGDPQLEQAKQESDEAWKVFEDVLKKSTETIKAATNNG